MNRTRRFYRIGAALFLNGHAYTWFTVKVVHGRLILVPVVHIGDISETNGGNGRHGAAPLCIFHRAALLVGDYGIADVFKILVFTHRADCVVQIRLGDGSTGDLNVLRSKHLTNLCDGKIIRLQTVPGYLDDNGALPTANYICGSYTVNLFKPGDEIVRVLVQLFRCAVAAYCVEHDRDHCRIHLENHGRFRVVRERSLYIVEFCPDVVHGFIKIAAKRELDIDHARIARRLGSQIFDA